MHTKFIPDKLNCGNWQDPLGLLIIPYIIITEFTIVLLDMAYVVILMLLWNAQFNAFLLQNQNLLLGVI